MPCLSLRFPILNMPVTETQKRFYKNEPPALHCPHKILHNRFPIKEGSPVLLQIFFPNRTLHFLFPVPFYLTIFLLIVFSFYTEVLILLQTDIYNHHNFPTLVLY